MTGPPNGNFDLDEALAVLSRTPAVLRAMLAALPEAWATCTEGPDSSSAFSTDERPEPAFDRASNCG
jgi:hypothetical protein